MISKNNTNCLVAGIAQNTFSRFYADIVFFSAKGVSFDRGVISDCDTEEIFVREAMFKNARKKVFLCNSEKVGIEASYIQCLISDIDAVVCENDAFNRFKEHFPELEII